MATDFTFLVDRVLGGDQGEGVLIESIAFKQDADKEGNDVVVVEISGTAKTMLRDNYNPTLGFTELPQEIPVTQRVVLASGKASEDNHISLEAINRQFQIEPPLVDGPELWERFTEDGAGSVYHKIVGNRAYFAANKNKQKTGEKLTDYYWNIRAVAKRVEAKKDNLKDLFAKINAKKGAASTFTVD